MEMVDVEKELKLRELKPAFGPMSRLRNRRQLHSAVEAEDKVILEAFQVQSKSLVKFDWRNVMYMSLMFDGLVLENGLSIRSERAGAKRSIVTALDSTAYVILTASKKPKHLIGTTARYVHVIRTRYVGLPK